MLQRSIIQGNNDKYTINKLNFSKLGETMYEGIASRSGQKVLIQQKKMQKFNIEMAKTFLEITFNYIINILDFFQQENTHFIVMEFCEESLYDYKNQNEYPNDYSKRNEIFLQIVKGVEELHNQGYFHRNLKLENVFIFTDDKGNTKYKLSGFNLIKGENQNAIQTKDIGTPYYMAPEQQTPFYHKSVDIWALGLLWFELHSRVPFFNGNNEKEILQKIINISQDQIYEQINNNQYLINQKDKEILKQLLVINPEQRLNIMELKKNLEHNDLTIIKFSYSSIKNNSLNQQYKTQEQQKRKEIQLELQNKYENKKIQNKISSQTKEEQFQKEQIKLQKQNVNKEMQKFEFKNQQYFIQNTIQRKLEVQKQLQNNFEKSLQAKKQQFLQQEQQMDQDLQEEITFEFNEKLKQIEQQNYKIKQKELLQNQSFFENLKNQTIITLINYQKQLLFQLDKIKMEHKNEKKIITFIENLNQIINKQIDSIQIENNFFSEINFQDNCINQQLNQIDTKIKDFIKIQQNIYLNLDSSNQQVKQFLEQLQVQEDQNQNILQLNQLKQAYQRQYNEKIQEINLLLKPIESFYNINKTLGIQNNQITDQIEKCQNKLYQFKQNIENSNQQIQFINFQEEISYYQKLLDQNIFEKEMIEIRKQTNDLLQEFIRFINSQYNTFQQNLQTSFQTLNEKIENLLQDIQNSQIKQFQTEKDVQELLQQFQKIKEDKENIIKRQFSNTELVNQNNRSILQFEVDQVQFNIQCIKQIMNDINKCYINQEQIQLSYKIDLLKQDYRLICNKLNQDLTDVSKRLENQKLNNSLSNNELEYINIQQNQLESLQNRVQNKNMELFQSIEFCRSIDLFKLKLELNQIQINNLTDEVKQWIYQELLWKQIINDQLNWQIIDLKKQCKFRGDNKIQKINEYIKGCQKLKQIYDDEITLQQYDDALIQYNDINEQIKCRKQQLNQLNCIIQQLSYGINKRNQYGINNHKLDFGPQIQLHIQEQDSLKQYQLLDLILYDNNQKKVILENINQINELNEQLSALENLIEQSSNSKCGQELFQILQQLENKKFNYKIKQIQEYLLNEGKYLNNYFKMQIVTINHFGNILHQLCDRLIKNYEKRKLNRKETEIRKSINENQDKKYQKYLEIQSRFNFTLHFLVKQQGDYEKQLSQKFKQDIIQIKEQIKELTNIINQQNKVKMRPIIKDQQLFQKIFQDDDNSDLYQLRMISLSFHNYIFK